MSAEESDDPRMDHIKISAQQIIQFDHGQWQELIWKEENKAMIKEFFDIPDTNMLLVHFDRNIKLTLSFEVPKNPPMPKQLCIFLKNSTVISMEDYKQAIAFCNVFDFPLKQYQLVFEKVITPIFCSPHNNQKWPDEIAHDISCHFQDFKTTLTYHVGLAEGRTVLMIPETAKLIEDFDLDNISESDSYDWKLRNTLNSVTEMLSNWIPVVRDVLELTSEQIFSQDQGPSTEIKFWNDRRNDLECIHTQVNEPIVRKMVLALEKINNCHFPKFRIFLQKVAEGLDEAREICTNFEAMSNKLKELDSCSLLTLKDILPDAMKVVTNSWMQSKYYKSLPSCITVLLQKISCLLIKKIHESLDPETLFKKDRDETADKVRSSLDMVNVFLKWYNDCREEFESSELQPYPWEFPDKRVFSLFEKFIQRLKQILEIFEAAEVYFSLSSHKLSNVQQASYRIRIEDLRSKFFYAYHIFELSNYNPLDLTSENFAKDYDVFLMKLKELDSKLGIAIGQACLSCVPAEDAFKMFDIFHDVLERSLVQNKFRKLISSHVSNIYNEVVAAHQSYSSVKIQDKCDKVVYRNLPPISGAVQWIIDQHKKISSPIESLQKVALYFRGCDEYKYTLKTYQEVTDLLSYFQNYVTEKWKVILDDVEEKLHKKLFITDKDNLLLNFNYQISEVTQEVRYLKQIKKNDLLPSDALKFAEKSENLLLTQSLLACSAKWYNDLKRDLLDHEKIIISKQWDEITSLFENGYSKTWISDGLFIYAEQLYSLTKYVYESVNQAKRNILEVQESINLWNTTAMFVRESSNSLVDFNINMMLQVEEQIRSVKKSADMMNDVLEKNQELFKSDPNSDEWKKYILYLESLIENGLKKSIACNLQYILENTNSENKRLVPFYKISMILDDDLKFVPPLIKDKPGSLFEVLETVLEKIYSPAQAITQIVNSKSTYYDVICLSEELKSVRSSINKNISSGAANALKRAEEFSQYSDMWLMSIQEVLEDFVLYGPVQDDPSGEDDGFFEVPLELKPPTEEEFKIQIAEFDQLYKKVEDTPVVLNIESWLIMDVSSFKEHLLSVILNWSAAYKKKLIELKRLGKLRKLEDGIPPNRANTCIIT